MKLGGLEKILKKSAMFIVTGSLAFNLLTGCSKEESPTAPENKPPTVSIVEGPQNGQQVNEDFVDFSWTGEDDGYILKFKYMLSPTMNNYQETTTTSKSFTGLFSGDYFFSVLAMDNSQEWSEPSERIFSVYKEYSLMLQPGSDDGLDAYVWGNWEWGNPFDNCFTNYGLDSDLCVEYTEWGNEEEVIGVIKKRSYLKFNISSLPENATIINSVLNLYVYYLQIPPFQTDYNVQMFKVNSFWSESNIIWYDQPQIDDLVQDEVIVNEAGKWWDLDATLATQYWHTNNDNNGLCLKNPYETSEQYGYGEIKIYSSEWEDPEKRPKLDIKYILEQ